MRQLIGSLKILFMVLSLGVLFLFPQWKQVMASAGI